MSERQCSDKAQKGPGVGSGAGSAKPNTQSAPNVGTPSQKTSPNSSSRGKQG